MTDSSTKILDTGNQALANALATGKRLVPGRFRVGEAVNFVPSASGVNPTPNTIYTGGPDLIDVKIINKDTVRYALTLPESAGDFTIGNIILDFLQDGTTYIPGIWWASDVGIPKERYSIESVGNRFVISFFERFVDFAGAIAITVTPPVRASLVQYLNQGVIPSPETILYQQFVLQHHTVSQTPVFVTRRPQDNKYYATGYMQRLESPYFGAIHGGFVGDRYRQYRDDYVWGGWFISPDSEYNVTIDCGDFRDNDLQASYIDDEW